MLVVSMETSPPYEERYLETFEVSSSTSSSIHVSWHLGRTTMPFVEAFRVHYQKVASTYIQYGPKLSPAEDKYEIENLVADTYYKVCLVIYRNDTSPFRECVDASTTNWQLPVSIGSSIGAILALSMIVLIVLLSRCKLPYKYKRQKSKRSSKYDTMSSNFHDDHYDFSETYTHGNEDDYTSELGPEDDGYYEPSVIETTKSRPGDKMTLPNGIGKGHVHTKEQCQHRNSLGRVHYHPHSHSHVSRPIRAYSIQADGQVCYFNQPCSPLAKDELGPAKLELNVSASHKDWRHQQRVDEGLPPQNDPQRYHSSPRRISLQEHSPLKISSEFFKHSIDNTHQDFPDRSHNSAAFTYMDEILPNLLSKNLSKPKPLRPMTPPREASPNNDNVCSSSLKFEDISAFGAVGGANETVVGQNAIHHWDGANKPVELTGKHRMIAEPEHVSFDEHTV